MTTRLKTLRIFPILYLTGCLGIIACHDEKPTETDKQRFEQVQQSLAALRTRVNDARGSGDVNIQNLEQDFESVMDMPPLNQFGLVRDAAAVRWEIEGLRLLYADYDDLGVKTRVIIDHLSLRPLGASPAITNDLENQAQHSADELGDDTPSDPAVAAKLEAKRLTDAWQDLEKFEGQAAENARAMLAREAENRRAMLVLDDIKSHEAARQFNEIVDRFEQRQRTAFERVNEQYQRWALLNIQEFHKWYFDNSHSRIVEAYKTFAEDEGLPPKNIYELMGVPPILSGPMMPRSPTRDPFFKVADIVVVTSKESAEADLSIFERYPELVGVLGELSGIDVQGPADLTPAKSKEIFNKVNDLTAWRYSEELAYKATAYAMTRHLLPIKIALLERPVQKLYNEAFEKGWKRLEGREDRLWVAKQSVVMPKVGMEDLEEKGE